MEVKFTDKEMHINIEQLEIALSKIKEVQEHLDKFIYRKREYRRNNSL